MNDKLHQIPMMQTRQAVNYTSLIDPYVVETLKTIIGKSVVIETVRGSLQGTIADVKPDHVVLKSYDKDTTFYVRLQQIVYVMPT